MPDIKDKLKKLFSKKKEEVDIVEPANRLREHMKNNPPTKLQQQMEKYQLSELPQTRTAKRE
tara:strand:+ start:280 stop:465 length:186 start_codon:yes stop_codon:yes gene_type:complete